MSEGASCIFTFEPVDRYSSIITVFYSTNIGIFSYFDFWSRVWEMVGSTHFRCACVSGEVGHGEFNNDILCRLDKYSSIICPM